MVYYHIFTYFNRAFLIARYDDKLAYFGIVEDALETIRADFPDHQLIETEAGFQPFIEQFREYEKGERVSFDLPLFLSGTPFQKEVYEALYKVNCGSVISYSDLAALVGDVKKVRAVANAIGKNRHLIVLPCHRIISKDGSLGGFSSGLDLKEVLINHERSE